MGILFLLPVELSWCQKDGKSYIGFQIFCNFFFHWGVQITQGLGVYRFRDDNYKFQYTRF